MHFCISIGVDVAIGLYFHLRYMVLILQGIFIVWSLLLSAGYFYIFSAMNKVAMRQRNDLIGSVYPKLILEGGTAYSENGQMQPLSTAVLKRPPLARAVQLTLGVAVLGSLLGGVQLFAMIKMLGLVKQDLSPNQNQWAWYGYQVSMRILEVTLCTLLAIVATTPLRSDVQGGGGLEQSPGSGLDDQDSCCLCCFGSKKKRRRRHKRSLCCPCLDSNPPCEFEDEIYSEICSNNQSVRQVLEGNPYGTMGGLSNGAGAGAPVQAPPGSILPLGAMNMNAHPHHNMGMPGHHGGGGNSMLAMGSSTLMPYNHKRAAAAYASQSATLLRSSQRSYPGEMLMGAQGVEHSGIPHQSSTSSRVTLDTQLYSNTRTTSRPSSMLFNDSGFVRFRMGNEEEPTLIIDNVINPGHGGGAGSSDRKKNLRASQSFDEGVLMNEAEALAKENDRTSPIYFTASDHNRSCKLIIINFLMVKIGIFSFVFSA